MPFDVVAEPVADRACLLLPVFHSAGDARDECGRSKMCKVDLSEVTARRVLSGEMAME